MFEVCNDIYFIVYNLYYVDQNDDLETRTWPINRDRGSTFLTAKQKIVGGIELLGPASKNLLPSCVS
jgi:hypothetical protein